MPEMDGLYLYQEMKKIDNKVRVCFLTASEMYYERIRQEKGLEKNLFLRKPILNEESLEQISAIMSQTE
jgi:CheY-like chemotaxis protein